jgi:hypothetical protein
MTKVYKTRNELKHFGVLGMHWGHRKARPAEVRAAIGNAAKTVGGKAVNAAKAVGTAFQEKHKSRVEINSAKEAHKATVKSLQSQIKQKDLATFNAAGKKIEQQEKVLNAKLDSIKARKLSEIDNSRSMGSVRKFLAKAVTNWDINARRENIIPMLEDKYHFEPDHKRNAARKKAEDAAIQKWAEKTDKRYEKEVKNLPFPQDIKAAMKMDREESMILTEELLRIKLAHS